MNSNYRYRFLDNQTTELDNQTTRICRGSRRPDELSGSPEAQTPSLLTRSATFKGDLPLGRDERHRDRCRSSDPIKGRKTFAAEDPKRTRNALQGDSALQFVMDVAKLNLMLSSDCSEIGTGSSNSPRSANESLSLIGQECAGFSAPAEARHHTLADPAHLDLPQRLQ